MKCININDEHVYNLFTSNSKIEMRMNMEGDEDEYGRRLKKIAENFSGQSL